MKKDIIWKYITDPVYLTIGGFLALDISLPFIVRSQTTHFEQGEADI